MVVPCAGGIPELAILLCVLCGGGVWFYNYRRVSADLADYFLKYLFAVAVILSALILTGFIVPALSGAILAPFLILYALRRDTALAWMGLMLCTAAVFFLGNMGSALSFALVAILFSYLYPWGKAQDWGGHLFNLIAALLVSAALGTMGYLFTSGQSTFEGEIPSVNIELPVWAAVMLPALYIAFRCAFSAHRRIMTDSRNIRNVITAGLIALFAFLPPVNPDAFFIAYWQPAYLAFLLSFVWGMVRLYMRSEKNIYDALAEKKYPVKISVVMPCHNGADFIEAAIRSVQDQTEKDWELLIINDGSQDGSQALIDQYTAADRRIKSFTHETALGAGAARNTGLANATGRYVAFLDCDDLWKPEKLSVQAAQMEQAGAALSTTYYDVIDENGVTTGRVEPFDRVFTFGRLLKCNDIGCSVAMIDRSFLGDVRFPDYRRAQDFVLWCTILRQGFLCLCIHQNLGAYRLHSKSRTLNKIQTSMNRIALLRRAVKVPVIVIPYYVAFYLVYGVIKQLRSGKSVVFTNKPFQKQS